MKISIITPTFPPYRGGIGNVAAAQHHFFREAGHQVTVITPKYPSKEFQVKDGVDWVTPKLVYGNGALLTGMHKKITGSDVVILHYPFFGGAEPLLLHSKKLKKKGTKIIVYYHMDVVGTQPLKSIIAIHKKIILPKIIKVADKVIVTSKDYAEHSFIQKQFKEMPDKFVEIPNGVDTQHFNPKNTSVDIFARHEINKDEKVALFVGGLDKAHYFKGVEHLIEAVSRLKQVPYPWRLVVVGKGELQQKYKDLAGQLRLFDKIIFADDVTNEMLPSYYAQADVTVLPSIDKSEAFGMVLVESYACATPVVASNIPGVRSVVEDGSTGLLCVPKNPDDLAAKIHYLFSNPEIAKQYGETALQKAHEKYDWQQVITATLDVIKK